MSKGLYIRKSKHHQMWYGYCVYCSPFKQFQFHFFGATLGYGLEHLRREHRG